MSTHTPGPWEISDQYIRPDYRDNKVICQWGSYTSEADAHLIAAAPDMLAALKEMVTWMPSGFAPQSKSIAMKMAYDAIAKAEGTS